MATVMAPGASAPEKVKADRTFGVGYSTVAAQLLSSLDQPVRNPEALMWDYREMTDTDETVGSGLEFLCFSVVSKIGAFSHPDERIKDLVDACVEKVGGTIHETRRALLENALAFGFGVSEFTLFPEEGRWLLSSLPSYDPTTLKFLFQRGADNALRIRTVRQRVAGRDLDIPAEKCLIFRHGAATTPYGRSRLRRCWRWHAFKRAIPKFWAVALERFGMPMLLGVSEDSEAMEALLRDAYAKAYFAVGPEDRISVVGTEKGGAGVGDAYEKAIEFCNRMIYRALFLPSLLEGGENGGSYSLGQVHWRMFNDAALWLARELAEAELECLWRPLIEWNFGPQKSYGTLDVADLGTPEEREMLSRIFLNGVNGGWLYPDEGDAAWMRERLGAPEEPEGGVTSWRSRLSRTPSSAGGGEKGGRESA